MSRSISCNFQRLWSATRALSGNLLDESGTALVEVAVVLSILVVPLLLGTTDLATLAYDSIEISDAAHAAAMYGMQSASTASQNSVMKTIAQADASDLAASNVAVTPGVYYVCSNAQGGTQYSTSSAATTACTGSGNSVLEFVQVIVSVPVTLPFTCCGLPSSVTLNSASTMQVEE